MKWILAIFIILLLHCRVSSQQLNLTIQLTQDSIWEKELKLEELSVQIGNWLILSGTDTVYANPNYSTYSFIDGNQYHEFNIQVNHLCCDEITKIQFQLGVDSLTHYKEIGCCGLEPGSDMYWTWQSGYIGIKIEGKDKKHNNWQYHLGGFQFPNRADQRIEYYPVDTRNQNWVIQLNLSNQLFHQLNDPPFKVMSPGQKSRSIMNQIASEIIIAPQHEK